MEIRNLEQLRDLSTLSRAIFQADVPEVTIRQMPAQTLYQVICYNGLESSIELIESATSEQVRTLLDFDLWGPEEFQEDNLWNWLELTSEDDELVILQKVIGSLDLKLVALLINKYLEVQSNEEPTDAAPGPLFFTPDRGLTWIRVTCEDQRKHFLMSKLLAFLFESNSDVFYQLLGLKAVTTPSVLEEEARLDKTKRLSAEGLPDLQFASEVTAFMSIAEAIEYLSKEKKLVSDYEAVVAEALARLSDELLPLTPALKELPNIEEGLSEMTLIINSVLVRFRANLSDNDTLLFMASQTQGALNLGLDILIRRTGLGATQILKKAGLQIPFRVGLTQILDVAKMAKKYGRELESQGLELELSTKSLIDLLSSPFPALPSALSKHRNDYAIDGDLLTVRPEPFRYFSEIESIRANLSQASSLSSAKS